MRDGEIGVLVDPDQPDDIVRGVLAALAAPGAGDDRHAARHCLEQHDPEALLLGMTKASASRNKSALRATGTKPRNLQLPLTSRSRALASRRAWSGPRPAMR
jgi:hypothetical protein